MNFAEQLRVCLRLQAMSLQKAPVAGSGVGGARASQRAFMAQAVQQLLALECNSRLRVCFWRLRRADVGHQTYGLGLITAMQQVLIGAKLVGLGSARVGNGSQSCTKGDLLKLYLCCLFNCSSLPSLSVDSEAHGLELPGLS